MSDNKRIKRIVQMESAMDRITAALKAGLPLSASRQKDLQMLKHYYQADWLSDYEADEKGKLPSDLKRGILSQDSLYDLLSEVDQKLKQIDK